MPLKRDVIEPFVGGDLEDAVERLEIPEAA